MQHEEGTARHEPGQAEDHEALRLVLDGAAPPAHAEGETPVGPGVRDRGDEQGEEIGQLGGHHELEYEVEQRERDGRQHADHAETQHLAEEGRRGRRLERRSAEFGVDLVDGDPAGDERAS